MKKKPKPITIKCAADIDKLFWRAQEALHENLCGETFEETKAKVRKAWEFLLHHDGACSVPKTSDMGDKFFYIQAFDDECREITGMGKIEITDSSTPGYIDVRRV